MVTVSLRAPAGITAGSALQACIGSPSLRQLLAALSSVRADSVSPTGCKHHRAGDRRRAALARTRRASFHPLGSRELSAAARRAERRAARAVRARRSRCAVAAAARDRRLAQSHAGGRDTRDELRRASRRCGLAITSGLAIGIDAAAHRGALAAGGGRSRSAAPGSTSTTRRALQRWRDASQRAARWSANSRSARRRCKHNFPRRNRIISGLALGTLVVEAARAQRLADHGAARRRQGREVFAIPGSIHNPLARGCHRLIRQGAKLVEDARRYIRRSSRCAASRCRWQRARRRRAETRKLTARYWTKNMKSC